VARLLRRVELKFTMKVTPSGRRLSYLTGGYVGLLPGLAGWNGSVAPILVSVRKQ
jgi:hypothetical protein